MLVTIWIINEKQKYMFVLQSSLDKIQIIYIPILRKLKYTNHLHCSNNGGLGNSVLVFIVVVLSSSLDDNSEAACALVALDSASWKLSNTIFNF